MDLRTKHSALTTAFPGVKFSLSGVDFAGSPAPFGVFQVFAQGKVGASVTTNWPVHPEIRTSVEIAAACAAEESILLCWFDDDLGSAMAVGAENGITHFSAENEDAFYALKSEKLEVAKRNLSDFDDALEAFALLDTALRQFLPELNLTYQVLAGRFFECSERSSFPVSKTRPSGTHPLLKLWEKPGQIRDAEEFAQLISRTLESNSSETTLSLALDFLGDPARPGAWVLPAAYSRPTIEALCALLDRGRPYSFVALESLEYILSNGRRPGGLALGPTLLKFAEKNPIKAYFNRSQIKELKLFLSAFRSKSKLGPRENQSRAYCLETL
ncbi:MAG: hypothetical protein JNM27_03330 [Leptospirales bacterium]|nr:hypothetical protein [Leptospirales bacterium]